MKERMVSSVIINDAIVDIGTRSDVEARIMGHFARNLALRMRERDPNFDINEMRDELTLRIDGPIPEDI